MYVFLEVAQLKVVIKSRANCYNLSRKVQENIVLK